MLCSYDILIKQCEVICGNVWMKLLKDNQSWCNCHYQYSYQRQAATALHELYTVKITTSICNTTMVYTKPNLHTLNVRLQVCNKQAFNTDKQGFPESILYDV